MVYDNLLDEADKENIYVIENAKFQSKASGLINNDVIGINKNVRSSAQRSLLKNLDITTLLPVTY